MLIGLITDSHIPEARRELFEEVYAAFRDVDLILHGGDMHDIVVLDWLEQGEALTILDTKDDWIQVQTQAGETGWVKGKYCGGQP